MNSRAHAMQRQQQRHTQTLITDDLSLSRLGRGRGGEATELISETQQLDNWQAIIQMECLLAVYIVTTQGTLI